MNVDETAIHPIIARNLNLMGYGTLRPIQAQAFDPILDGRDLIGLAQTGSGKTAAFLAPLAHVLISNKPLRTRGKPVPSAQRLRALTLCPTRELAQQIADEAAAITQGSVLRVACAYGKVAISPQANAIAKGVDLLVATPGRMRELIEGSYVDLSHIKHVIIDEADRMMDMGFLPQVRQILQAIPAERQTLLFTSTMPAAVEELARQFLREPVRIESEPHSTPVEHVRQHLLPVKDDRKVALLLHLLQNTKMQGVLIFCRTRRRVGWVNTALQRNAISSGMLRGDMSQAQRQRSLDRFTNGELRVLVATDVAGRGLHIPSVKVVINYDLPPTAEEYVHRMGRAAHGTKGSGDAFSFLSDDRDQRLLWREIFDQLHLQVFAESVAGFDAEVVRPRKRRSTPPKVEGADRPEKRRFQKSRRSKKSRPIKKNQKPGRGVVKRES